MSLSAGEKLGAYEMVAMIGAGGMGEVYRARDHKLDRDIAIKVLPDHFADDPDRLARFQREAKVLASLNHPHIGIIHDIQEDRGRRFLVLELVEGETLAGRLKRGPLPVDEALELLKQVAEALEAAHEKGIFHRDLKPANIQITPDGRAKVLDFGLAKMIEPGIALVDPANSPTLTGAQTAGGVILGTAAYMSPEQARGHAIDKRTDVWAFGCVLYEALTAQQVFGGDTVTDIIACVLKGEPDWSRLPASTPSTVRSLLRQCLQKQAKHRLHEIADARVAIEEALAEPAPTKSETRPAARPWRWMSPAVTACLVIGVVIGWLMMRKPPIAQAVTRFDISVQPADQLAGFIRPTRTAFALSPDGQLVVFSAIQRNLAKPQFYSRRLAESEATPIPGTEGAIGPFFAPDGQWIGFWAQGQIKKVSVAGGPAVVICDVLSRGTAQAGFGLFGASWAEDGSIFFSDTGIILKVASGGGTPVAVTMNDAAKGELHVLPQSAPGGKAVMFTSVTNGDWNKSQIVIQPLETHERRVLIQGGADARYVQTGHLVYMKTGTLMAVPFDARKLQVSGDPVALIENVMQTVDSLNNNDETGSGQWTVSSSGTLLYVTGGVQPSPEQSLVWVDRRGIAQPVSFSSPRSYTTPRISPDEDRMAVAVHAAGSNNRIGRDIWIYDLLRGAPIRLTTSALNLWEVWSPDGKRLVYSSSVSGVPNLYVMNADASGPIERLTSSQYVQAPLSWTAQGNLIAFVEFHPPNWQIWVLPMDGDRKPKLFLEARSTFSYPEFSPDGHWMAYGSVESGQQAVYVQPYPGPGEKHRISPDAGSEPIWSANGRELFYRQGPKFYSVAIAGTSPFRAEAPRLLFEGKPGEYATTAPVRSWDVSRDGQRFLLMRNEESKDKPVTQIHAVLNWTEELKRLVPGPH